MIRIAKSSVLSLWPVVLLVATDTLAFTIVPTQRNVRRYIISGIQTTDPSTFLNAKTDTWEENSGRAPAKSICSFDETDFSGRTSWPYTAADLNRLDNSDDSKFYDDPRLVTHIDDMAIQSLSNFYKESFEEMAAAKSKEEEETKPKTIDILDLCSSWISHLPAVESDSSFQYGTVVGYGMNQKELNENPQLTGNVVQDLNLDPKLASLEDESFDFVTMTVSIDYLIKPLESNAC
jgi:hypothetical protein